MYLMWQLVLGAILISFSPVFVKLVSVPPNVSAFYRMLFGGSILLGIMLWRRERLDFKPKAFLILCLAGLFFALDLAFWHRSVLYVGPGVSTLLANFQVFVLAGVGVLFFKERLSIQQWVAIVLALLGLALLVGSGWSRVSDQYHLGVILALLTAGWYAAYLLTLRSARVGRESGSPYAIITVISLVTALILAAGMGVEGESFVIPTWQDAGWLLLYGLVPQVIGWVLISHSMAKIGTAQVGLVLLLQPACALIWDGLFFGRHFSVPELVGAALALAAIYLGSLRSRIK